MMAQRPVFVVFSPQFIAREPLEIVVHKYPCGTLLITDNNNKVMLRVKPCNTRWHRQRMLLDANDQPMAKLRAKILTGHGRWNVFKGESKDDSDMIFTVTTEDVIQFETNARVMLENKIMSSNNDCDLRIKGSWSNGDCTIYMGDSSTAIAHMHKPQTSKYSKDKFTVTIQANIDYACVVALLAIVDAMENPLDKQCSSRAARGVVHVIGGVGCVVNVIEGVDSVVGLIGGVRSVFHIIDTLGNVVDVIGDVIDVIDEIM